MDLKINFTGELNFFFRAQTCGINIDTVTIITTGSASFEQLKDRSTVVIRGRQHFTIKIRSRRVISYYYMFSTISVLVELLFLLCAS